MTDERLGIFVRLFFAFRLHGRRCDLQGLACTHVAGLTTIHNVRFGHIDLDDCRIPIGNFLFQAVDLRRSQIHHVVGDVFIKPGAGCSHRFQNIAEFQAEFGAFVTDVVIGFFEFVKVKLLLASVGEFNGRRFFLIALDLVLLILFADSLVAVSSS